MPSTSDTPEPDAPHRTDARSELLLVDDGVVVYEPENPDTWIATDEPVPLAGRR